MKFCPAANDSEILFWIKMSDNGEKVPVNDVFKCLVLSDQQSETQRYSVYNYIKQRKATNLHA